MISCKVKNKVVKDISKDVYKRLQEISKSEVLVGIPEDKNEREEGGLIGNAAIAYINDKGSPLQKIPQREFMKPGIKAVEDRVARELVLAVKAKQDGNQQEMDKHLERAGLIASTSIKNYIHTAEFTPLSIVTKLQRIKRRKGFKKLSREEKEEIMESFRPLEDTGQMRNAVSYEVVKK